MKKINLLFLIVLSSVLIFQSCKKELKSDYNEATPNLELINNDFSIPSNLVMSSEVTSTYDYRSLEPNDNKITNDGAALGRVLFYDKKMSLNNKVSCGSCHIQKFAFSDGLLVLMGRKQLEILLQLLML